jgi:hypothetical protein
MKNYIGKKIRGFRFESEMDDLLFNREMQKNIGEIGEIIVQHESSVKIQFEKESWYYPISLVEQYLVEETPEISGLEALFIVHGGWHTTEEEKILYDKCIKIIQQHKQRLQSIYINQPTKYTHAELVEKLGHDFEII